MPPSPIGAAASRFYRPRATAPLDRGVPVPIPVRAMPSPVPRSPHAGSTDGSTRTRAPSPAIAQASVAPSDSVAGRIAKILRLDDKFDPQSTTKTAKKVGRQLEAAFRPHDSKRIVTRQQTLNALGATTISFQDAVRVFALGARFHAKSRTEGTFWMAQYVTTCLEALLEAAAEDADAEADALHDHLKGTADRDLAPGQRDAVETGLYNAPMLRAAESADSREAAWANAKNDLNAPLRIATIAEAPLVRQRLERLGADLGTEETPRQDIADDMFDELGRLLPDRLEARLLKSTGRAIVDAWNSKSWAGVQMLAGSSLQDALALFNEEQAKTNGATFDIGLSLEENEATIMAVTLLTLTRHFIGYFGKSKAGVITLNAGELPALQAEYFEDSAGLIKAGSTKTLDLHPACLTSELPSRLSVISMNTASGVKLKYAAAHECAHAFESYRSYSMVDSVSKGVPAIAAAITESTADFIGYLMSGETSNHYQRIYDGQVRVAQVLQQICTARGMTSKDAAIGLDILLRAHLMGEPGAVEELRQAWEQVLDMPQYASTGIPQEMPQEMSQDKDRYFSGFGTKSIMLACLSISIAMTVGTFYSLRTALVAPRLPRQAE